jgi:diguanylate cyclase (GGDEF)-like protein
MAHNQLWWDVSLLSYRRVAPPEKLHLLNAVFLPEGAMHRETEGVLARMSQQLAQLEKRDGELWLIVSLAGLLVGAGLLAILFPAAFLKQGNIHFEITVSRPLVLGLVALLTLLNTYLVSRRIELRRLREELISRTIQHELVQQQSFTDPLTEIYNRHSLQDMANRFISHARRSKKPLTLMLIDVDRFKDVNTRFGHLTGDVVLANVAGLLKHSVRGSDAVFRYGGDEFLIILADTAAGGTTHVVERIRAGLAEWNRAGHLEGFTLELSIGVAEWSDGKNLEELLDSADQGMFAAKADQKVGRAKAAGV